MSVTVNDKGGTEQRVNLIKRGKGRIQHIMLNSTLIHKAENYSLLTDRFLINNLPGIMQSRRQLVEIRPRFALGQANAGFPPNAFLALRNTYTPPELFSVGAFCESLAQFFRHFNFGLYMAGANYSNFLVGATQWYVPQQQQFTAQTAFDLRNHIPEANVTKHVSLGFEADGSLQLFMSSQFLSNYFVILDPIFALQIGFPEQIYSGYDDALVPNVVMSNQDGVQPLLTGGGNFAFTSFVDHEKQIISTGSVFSLDDRLSIDVEIAMPLARTIDVHNSKEKQTYLLSRFIVKDYIEVETIAQQRGGFLITKSLMQDKLSTGFLDLVANEPGTHVSQLKPGAIRELDIRLALRYKEFEIINSILTYSIKHKTFEMDADGCYDLLMTFNKKV